MCPVSSGEVRFWMGYVRFKETVEVFVLTKLKKLDFLLRFGENREGEACFTGNTGRGKSSAFFKSEVIKK